MLIVEVLNVFLVDRVPQRLPSSRLLLRLLIGRCHKPRFMVDMTSGCAVVDVENDNEYYWNRWDNSTCWRLPRGVKHRWCLVTTRYKAAQDAHAA